MTLTFFSHSRPMVGGSTRAWAEVTMALPDDGVGECIRLNQRGKEGDPSVQEYDKLQWRDYHVELMPPFNYDVSITVKVTSPLLK